MNDVLSLAELVIDDETERGLFGTPSISCGQTSAVSDHC
ncbi:hypothetical protein Caci_7171 [Catenulispora acidiphila DSM 44928]|uniref:Uncharacterized protein n=1 Tax=Catenulispora acidiphila (strain DSM 44928 / JCM 14897 / NBRC 102108 / NRRL B-24433 / ID139908) TaxID=479433 RepID=C7Q6Y7_CATAD|nr:hypothetical protein Caci_7171 [Catenulispora acidiphila DSM 44928]